MTSNELRIGNWVMGNKPYQWGLDDFADWYYDHNSHTYGDSVKPIPLTEEWLEKFGFGKTSPADELFDMPFLRYRDSPWGEEIRKWHNQDHFTYNVDETREIDILYVHELQNLFFALTGEELTIK